MKFFYSSGAMGYAGEGYFWHKLYTFPELPLVTKTLTLLPKQGLPYAVVPVGRSVYNKVSLHNVGFYKWYSDNRLLDGSNITPSLAGSDEDIAYMVRILDNRKDIKSVELNFSCPNVTDHKNTELPVTDKTIYLKLNYLQDPFDYDLDKVEGIRVNSIPLQFCGGSGKVAQKKNWRFIKKYIREGLNVAGCSFTSYKDIKRLEGMGCSEIGIGSAIITNPRLIEDIQSLGTI